LDSKSTSKSFPGFDKIFALGDPVNRTAFRGDVDVETDALELTRAELHPAQAVTVDWAMGRAQPSEVIWTTMGSMVIIADSVVQMLRSHGFTGWSLYDVSVRNKQGQRVSGYCGLAVTGRGGQIDNSQSVEVPRIFPAGISPPLDQIERSMLI
jgi:hypothetical protein